MRSSPARSLRCWIATLHAQAVVQVQALKREFSEDAGASARRKRAAAERVARNRQERLAQALTPLDQLKPLSKLQTPKPSKTAGGGFRPAVNVQLGVDVQPQLIAAVAAANASSDMGQMSPMHDHLQQRYALTPEHWLADGGDTKLQAIDELTERGTQPVLPAPASRNPDIDPLAAKPTDTAVQAQWRTLMASDWGKALYV